MSIATEKADINSPTVDSKVPNAPVENKSKSCNAVSSPNPCKLIDVACQTEFVVVDVDLAELKRRMATVPDEVQEPLTAESIAETAQSVLNKSGWVYDESTRTYFDYNTNLYYYPQTCLYYNYRNGCYYRYNQEAQKYEFHYQIESFKNKSQDSQQQSAAREGLKRKRLLFPTLKKLKYTFRTCEMSCKAERNIRADESENGAGISTPKNHYLLEQKLESLTSKARNKLCVKKNSCTNGYLSDSERQIVKSIHRNVFMCKKCATLTTPFCCQNKRIPSSKKKFASPERKDNETSYEDHRNCFSDTEIDTLSASNTKYIQCRRCKRIALSFCCEKLKPWLDKMAVTKPLKRKRCTKRRKRKRKRSCVTNSDSSGFTDKESEHSLSVTNREIALVKAEAPNMGTLTGDKVEYTFNTDMQNSALIPNMETESNIIPCIRAMVTSSQILKVGTLYLITCNGATIGSSDSCDIQIQEEGVSGNHASIMYNQEQKNYFVTDFGSESGTTLNSTSSYSPGTKAVISRPVTHKSVLLIGSCIFVLHLHLGHETCDDCEPGQIQAILGQDRPNEVVISLTKGEKEAIRRSELKSIKKKYDLHKEQYKQSAMTTGTRYNDRAAERRRTIGSDNPYEKDEMPTSYDTELADHNKGHQMLKKMGWSKGKSLGKSQKGIKEPIVPQRSGKGTLGLGFGRFQADTSDP